MKCANEKCKSEDKVFHKYIQLDGVKYFLCDTCHSAVQRVRQPLFADTKIPGE